LFIYSDATEKGDIYDKIFALQQDMNSMKKDHQDLKTEFSEFKAVLGVGEIFHLLLLKLRGKGDEERQWFLSKLGVSEREVSIARAFYASRRCQQAHPSVSEEHLLNMPASDSDAIKIANKLYGNLSLLNE
jgi:hypothetical protein